MKRTLFAALLVLCTAALTISCCRCRQLQRRTQRPLVGTQWQLAQFEGRDRTPEGETFTLLFHADGRLSGQGACNRIMGGYEADDKGGLSLARLGTTRMACPDLEEERRFIEMLEGVTHYEMDGPMLLLLHEGELRAVMQAVDAPAEEQNAPGERPAPRP